MGESLACPPRAVQPGGRLEHERDPVRVEEVDQAAQVLDRHHLVGQDVLADPHIPAGRGDHTVDPDVEDLVPDLHEGSARAQEHLMATGAGRSHGSHGAVGDQSPIVEQGAVEVQEDGPGGHAAPLRLV